MFKKTEDLTNEEKTAIGKGRVSVHSDFPAVVLEMLAMEVATQFQNGTEVVIDVGRHARLMPCPKKHIHIEFTPDAPMAEMSVLLVIAFATALVCDQRKQWMGPKPEPKAVVAVIDSLITNEKLEDIRDTLMAARERAERIISNADAEPQKPVLH